MLAVITLNSNGQGTLIKYKQMENPATSSVNLGTQILNAGATTLASLTSTGSVTSPTVTAGVGTFTGALNTTSTFTATGASVLTGGVTTPTVWGSSTSGGGLFLGSTSNATKGTITLGSTSSTVAIGPTSFSLGGVNLTGGNTGTVSVMTDEYFNINLMGLSTSPADATTYYFGNVPFGWLQNQGNGKVYIPVNCTLMGYSANFFDNGVLASSESSTLSALINNSTNVVLSSAVAITTLVNNYNASNLNQSITAGDYIECKLITPTWTLNPTSTGAGITLWFKGR